jgi:hypothetical protein
LLSTVHAVKSWRTSHLAWLLLMLLLWLHEVAVHASTTGSKPSTRLLLLML